MGAQKIFPKLDLITKSPNLPYQKYHRPATAKSLLPFPLSTSRLDSPPEPIRNQRFKVIPEHSRRERDERARSLFVKREVFDSDGLKDIYSHRADVYAQEGRDGGGFHGAVLPEVVGAEVGPVRFRLDGRGTCFYVIGHRGVGFEDLRGEMLV